MACKTPSKFQWNVVIVYMGRALWLPALWEAAVRHYLCVCGIQMVACIAVTCTLELVLRLQHLDQVRGKLAPSDQPEQECGSADKVPAGAHLKPCLAYVHTH